MFFSSYNERGRRSISEGKETVVEFLSLAKKLDVGGMKLALYNIRAPFLNRMVHGTSQNTEDKYKQKIKEKKRMEFIL